MRTYDYTNDCKYHRYNDEEENEYEHYNVIIYDKTDITKIVSTGKNGEILMILNMIIYMGFVY